MVNRGGQIGVKRPDLAQRNRERATHGRTNTPTWRVWNAMRQRCNTVTCSAFPAYGGRGIQVSSRWASFETFLADMGEAPAGMQIDRINNSGHYSPENCRWVSAKENCRNRRSNVYIEHHGIKRSIAEWAEVTGLERKTLEYRIRSGWPTEKALTTPSMTNRKNSNVNFIGVNQ